MNINNPAKTIVNFFKLIITRYVGINLMGDKMENIFNYLKISDKLTTAGQPTEQQLALVKDAGYETIINLALPTSENALADEKKSVESLGMKYINIPIDFNHPTVEEFELFSQVMKQHQDQQIFIHCAANLRVSAFIYLYRQIYLDVNEKQAKADLEKLWTPNKTWQTLINSILDKN